MIIDKNDRIAYWLAIDIANNMGKDKLSFDKRIEWVESNFDGIFNLEYDIDSPWEARNAIDALQKHLDGHKVAHRVYLDASNQALQLYAVLTRDLQTASTCNLANGEMIADAYQMIADGMNPYLESYGLFLTRKNCKKALMTTMYGKKDGSIEIVKSLVTHLDDEHEQFQYFANKYGMTYDTNMLGTPFIDELKNLFAKVLSDIAPNAIRAMATLTEINSNMVLPTYRWTMPDGFRVKFDVNMDITKGPTRYKTRKGLTVTLPKITKKVYKASDVSLAMSPNIIHSVDGYVARQMVRRMNGKFITTIHDAFGCHPADCDLMIQNYKNILIEILGSNLLNDVISEIQGTPSMFKTSDDLLAENIQNSMYLLA